MSSAAVDLQGALLSTGLVQPIDVKGKGGRLEIFCRLIPGQEKAWVAVMDGLLSEAALSGINLHVCRRYVRRDGTMVFGYHIGVESPTAKILKDAVDVIIEELKKAKPSLAPASPTPRPQPKAQTQEAPTDARPPGPPSNGFGQRPARFDPTVRVVETKRGDDGSETIVEEMPLPHVYRELNKPDPAKGRDGRGARTISTNSR